MFLMSFVPATKIKLNEIDNSVTVKMLHSVSFRNYLKLTEYA